jgi:diguanylate cyclase (GGDEF)-like protein
MMHEDTEKEWGFMFNENKSLNLENDNPKLWNEIEKNRSGQILINNTMFTYIKIDPTKYDYILSSLDNKNKNGLSSKYRWVIVSSISEKYILQMKSDIDQNLIWIFGLLSIFMAFIASLYSKSKYSEYLSLEIIKDKNLELIEKNKEVETQKKALRDMNSYLEEKNEQLFLHSTIDPLTNTYSRRYFTELFSKELTKSKRHPSPLCCIIFDIDHFKKVNDNYGHLAGDYILKSVSKIIHREIRNEDIFGRYGGDEFVIVLPAINLNNAEIVAEKIRKSIHNETFVFDTINIKITLSIGISAVDDSIDTIEAAIENSDSALYLAKGNGRNRVEVYRGK